MLFARDGDREAFASIVRGYADEIRRFTMQLVPDLDTDDVVQDTFIRLWKSLPTFRHDASGRTFLYGIARRAAIDELRRKQRRRCIANHLHVVDAHSDLGEVHAIQALVGGLTDERREAFVMTQLQGFSYDEAAEMIGVPVGTIRSRVSRARSELATSYDAASASHIS